MRLRSNAIRFVLWFALVALFWNLAMLAAAVVK